MDDIFRKPTDLKILCCNIRKNLPEDVQSGNGWDARKELCAEVMVAQGAGVICLQECTDVHYEDLRARLPEFDGFGLANPDTVFNPGNAILFLRSRFEMISAGGFWLSETPHIAGTQSWDSARSRFVNWVQLRDRNSEQEFRVWNAHLDHIGQVAREKQAELIMQASEVLPADLPQVLTGDLNADAANPAIDVVRAAGWLDTYVAIHGPEDPGFTFHAFLGTAFAESRPKDKIKGKIDFIFCRGPVKPLAAGIIRDSRDGRYPSDHYFLSADVVVG